VFINIGRKIEYIKPKITAPIEMIFNVFSYFIGTEVLIIFDTSFSLIIKPNNIGNTIVQIIKIHAFHIPISNAGINEIVITSF
jgi:hypothetical protein